MDPGCMLHDPHRRRCLSGMSPRAELTHSLAWCRLSRPAGPHARNHEPMGTVHPRRTSRVLSLPKGLPRKNTDRTAGTRLRCRGTLLRCDSALGARRIWNPPPGGTAKSMFGLRVPGVLLPSAGGSGTRFCAEEHCRVLRNCDVQLPAFRRLEAALRASWYISCRPLGLVLVMLSSSSAQLHQLHHRYKIQSHILRSLPHLPYITTSLPTSRLSTPPPIK